MSTQTAPPAVLPRLVPHYVAQALEHHGYDFRTLPPAAKLRACDVPHDKPELRGKALAVWVSTGMRWGGN